MTPYVRGEPVIYLDGKPVRWLAEWREPVLTGSLARPLYDTANGGPPRAWECLVCPHDVAADKIRSRNPGHTPYYGRTVLASEVGMKLHLRQRHKIVIQGNLFTGYQSDLAPATPGSKIEP